MSRGYAFSQELVPLPKRPAPALSLAFFAMPKGAMLANTLAREFAEYWRQHAENGDFPKD